MADNTNTFEATVASLFQGMDDFVSSKTVVGEAIQVGENTLVPLVDVSFGIAAGSFHETNKKNSGGGMGGKITPTAVLVINKNGMRMVQVKASDAVSKIIDMAPDLINRFAKKSDITDDEIREIVEGE